MFLKILFVLDLHLDAYYSIYSLPTKLNNTDILEHYKIKNNLGLLIT